MVREDAIFKQNISFRVRNIAKQTLLLGDGKSYQLNETALSIWENINGKRNIEEVYLELKNIYSLNDRDMEQILSFIKFLEGIGAIKRVS